MKSYRKIHKEALEFVINEFLENTNLELFGYFPDASYAIDVNDQGEVNSASITYPTFPSLRNLSLLFHELGHIRIWGKRTKGERVKAFEVMKRYPAIDKDPAVKAHQLREESGAWDAAYEIAKEYELDSDSKFRKTFEDTKRESLNHYR